MKTLTLAHYLIILIIGFLICTTGCNPDDNGGDPEPSLKVTLNDPTNVTETSFTANWTVNKTNIQSCQVELSLQSDFSNVLKTVTVSDPMKTSQLIDGLHGATNYYHRIKVTLDDGTTSGVSNSKEVATSFQSESITVETIDGLSIVGSLYYLNSNPTKSPAVILMGVFSLSNQWKVTDVFYNLVASGYVCYIINYRGHGGGSDSWPIIDIETVEELEEFAKVHARNDLHACYTYLKNHQKVDPERIGLMGGSLGANESMIGNNWPGVKVSVGLSTSRLGIEEGFPLHNVLFIASDLDCNSYICFEEEAIFLSNSALEPKKVIIVPGDFHGLELLGQENVDQEIIDWINARMED